MFSDVVTLNGAAKAVTDAVFSPLPAWWVRAAADGDVWAAVAQAGTGTCQVVDSLGHRWDSGDTAFGVQCVGIQPHAQGWEVVWMRAPLGATYARIILDRDLKPTTSSFQQFPSPFGQTSQGFLDLTPAGEPRMTDQYRVITCGPVAVGLSSSRGVWTVGQDWNGDRVIAWNAETMRAYEVARISTQTPSHLTLVNGSPVVVIGGTDILVTEAQFVPWAPWVAPSLPEPPERLQPIVTPPPNSPPPIVTPVPVPVPLPPVPPQTPVPPASLPPASQPEPAPEPTPDPEIAPMPSGGKRKPNIAKALRDLFRALAKVFR